MAVRAAGFPVARRCTALLPANMSATDAVIDRIMV